MVRQAVLDRARPAALRPNVSGECRRRRQWARGWPLPARWRSGAPGRTRSCRPRMRSRRRMGAPRRVGLDGCRAADRAAQGRQRAPALPRRCAVEPGVAGLAGAYGQGAAHADRRRAGGEWRANGAPAHAMRRMPGPHVQRPAARGVPDTHARAAKRGAAAPFPAREQVQQEVMWWLGAAGWFYCACFSVVSVRPARSLPFLPWPFGLGAFRS